MSVINDECHKKSFKLGVVMPNVVILSVVMLNAVAPLNRGCEGQTLQLIWLQ
jgi:hypothetical protein